MSKFKKYLKLEADVEFIACIHGVTTIFMYGLLQWIGGMSDIPFSIIVEQMVLGYIIAWVQKGLFLREGSYKKSEYFLREILWCAVPVVLLFLAGIAFHWFSRVSFWIAAAFYLCMACFFVMVWLFWKIFYWEETREMNQLLKKRKQEGHDI